VGSGRRYVLRSIDTAKARLGRMDSNGPNKTVRAIVAP
jgi:hypothetical protein